MSKKTDGEFILKKPLEDGSLTVGLFNLTSEPRHLAVNWRDVGVKGTQTVRDVWRERDLGSFSQGFAAEAPAHGVILVRLLSAETE